MCWGCSLPVSSSVTRCNPQRCSSIPQNWRQCSRALAFYVDCDAPSYVCIIRPLDIHTQLPLQFHGSFLETLHKEGIKAGIDLIVRRYEGCKAAYEQWVRDRPMKEERDFSRWLETKLVEGSAIGLIRTTEVDEARSPLAMCLLS